MPTARAAGRAIATGTTRQRQRSGRWGVTYDIGALVTADRGDLHAIAAASAVASRSTTLGHRSPAAGTLHNVPAGQHRRGGPAPR